MRITADIDEEPCPECNAQENSKPERRIRIVMREPPNTEVSEKLVDGMLKQFQKLSIRFIPSASKSSAPTGIKAVKTVHEMDSTKGSAEASNYQACCISYAEKMKEEIKKEVIEEVLKILKQGEPTAQPVTEKDATTSDFWELVAHPGITCDNCDEMIYGIRYKCGNCEDFDLCENCEKIPGVHNNRHVFLKLRLPLSVLAGEEPRSNEACMVRDEDGCYVFRPKSVPAKTHNMPEAGDRAEKLDFDAKFLFDETIKDGEMVECGSSFLKKWRVSNCGLKSWEKEVVVILLHGELKADLETVLSPPLKPGEEGVVSVYFNAPKTDGIYTSYWEFRHQGKRFGDTLWCTVRVGQQVPLECIAHGPTSERLQKFPLSRNMYGNQIQYLKSRRKAKEEKKKRKDCRRKEVKQIVDVLTAVQEEHGCRRPGSDSLKPVVTSHTATPNNTPFDLSPPKSPEPHEFIEVKSDTFIRFAEFGLQGLEKVEQQVNIVGNEYDEKFSITTASSSESDSEFVVIPMPECFSVLEDNSANEVASVEATDGAVSSKTNGGSSSAAMDTSAEFIKQPGSSEQVSQETGAPEEAENINLNTTIEVKENCDKNMFVKCGISLSNSPSSSSVSVIESEDNSSPSAPSAPLLLQDVGRLVATGAAVSGQNGNLVEEQQNNDSAQACTFPKFPLDTDDPPTLLSTASTVTSASTTNFSNTTLPSNTNESERTVQVLPEGLVTGALIAAASLYNTAKSVFSSVQPGRIEQEEEESTSMMDGTTSGRGTAVADSSQSPQEQLIEMGFCNRVLNERILREKKGDVAAVVAELVNLDDNDWYASRSPNDPAPGN